MSFRVVSPCAARSEDRVDGLLATANESVHAVRNCFGVSQQGCNCEFQLTQRRQIMINSKDLYALGAVLFALVLTSVVSAGDSSDLSGGFSIVKRADGSILGDASNRKLCRFHSEDNRIHCNSENPRSVNAAPTEFLAVSNIRPRFANFGSNTSALLSISRNARYAFANPESTELINGGTAFAHCKLALQFQLANRDTFWIWHDEIRFNGSRTAAFVDSDGDGQADFAARGSWTGRVNGTRRWESVDPRSRRYTAAQMRFPTRPNFGSTSGLRRNCRVSEVVIVKLASDMPILADNVTGRMRTTLNVSDN